jgi:Subtilase family
MKHLAYRFLASLICVQTAMVFPVAAEEAILHPDGLNSSPCWALNRVGKEFSAGSSYSYPDTTTPVRLYLIDTAVSNPSTFVAANPKLTFEGPYLVRGAGDPLVSTPRAHGTQLLSLIAGIDTGVAPGTPIHVVNYDIYPSSTTTISLLSSAIIQAVQHHRDSEGPDVMRSVICIATSSAEQAQSELVADSIDFALSEGIPVVLSAGNLGQDASNIVPSLNGTKNGVICVGASDHGDVKLASSNFGAPVDLLAPGLGVRTRGESASSEVVLMDGTSPAAALVTGAVIAKLSKSPTHTPAGIESSLKAAAEVSASGLRLLRSIVPPESTSIPPDVVPDGLVTPEASSVPLTWESVISAGNSAIPPPAPNAESAPPPAPDVDSDGIPDIVEVFHGSAQGLPQGPEISLSADQKIQFKFSIESDLLDGENPFVLRNGYTWRIRCSSGLSSWVVPEGELVKSTAQGRTWLTASFPVTGPSCFARIEIVAP